MEYSGVGVGMRISAAAKRAPGGGLEGRMETLPMMGEVPFGKEGTDWTVRVEESSWRT